MARTAMAFATTSANDNGQTITPYTPDSSVSGAGNGYAVYNQGRTVIFAIDTTTNTPTITVKGVTDSYRQSGDKAKAIPAGAGPKFQVAGPFSPAGYNQPDDTLTVEVTSLGGTPSLKMFALLLA